MTLRVVARSGASAEVVGAPECNIVLVDPAGLQEDYRTPSSVVGIGRDLVVVDTCLRRPSDLEELEWL